MRTVEAARSAVDRARAEGYDFSCPRCGSQNSVRIAAYGGGKPENWFARCFRCNQSFRIKKKVKEEKDVEPMEVYQPQPAQQEAPAPVPAEKPPAKTSLARLRELLTKDEYLRLKAEGKTDRDIISELGTHPASFYALKQEWGLVGQAAPSAPKSPTKEKPASPAPTLEEALQGVACPVPGNAQVSQIWSDISRLDSAFKVLDGLVEDLAKTVKYLEATLVAMREAALTRADVERFVREALAGLPADLAEVKSRLRYLEEKHLYHRHQVGPGHWSGKAET